MINRSPLKLFKYPSLVINIIILMVILLVIFFAPIISPYEPLNIVSKPLESLNNDFLLGTDEVGRDIFTRLLYGGRPSLSIGFLSSLIAMIIGVPFGLLAGTSKGVIETIIMRTMDGLLGFPSIILALAVLSIFPSNIFSVSVAISIPFIPRLVRIVRSEVLSIWEKEYVEAAIALGVSRFYLLFKVVLLNCISPILISFSLYFSLGILLESQLGFLGFGIQPPYPSWGYMINRGMLYLRQNPWYSISPGFAVFISALSLNRLGDILRDILDPKQIKR